jgi:hypothetical protein
MRFPFFILVLACAARAACQSAVADSLPHVLASITLGAKIVINRMAQVQHYDGETFPTVAAGLEGHELRLHPGRPELYAYFQLDASVKIVPTNHLIVMIEYFDPAPGKFAIDYDSFDGTSKNEGAYTRTRTRVELKGDNRWHRAAFVLEKPRLERRQNSAADFRIAVVGSALTVRSLVVRQE